jgi:hypothetical protein
MCPGRGGAVGHVSPVLVPCWHLLRFTRTVINPLFALHNNSMQKPTMTCPSVSLHLLGTMVFLQPSVRDLLLGQTGGAPEQGKQSTSGVSGNMESGTVPTRMVQILYVAITLGCATEVLNSSSRAIFVSEASPPELGDPDWFFTNCVCSTTLTATIALFHLPARGKAPG